MEPPRAARGGNGLRCGDTDASIRPPRKLRVKGNANRPDALRRAEAG